MKHIDTVLTDIAVKHLRIPTLVVRRSDSLDFHCVSVWGVRDALQAAFDAGVASALPRPEAAPELPDPYDVYEIHGVAAATPRARSANRSRTPVRNCGPCTPPVSQGDGPEGNCNQVWRHRSATGVLTLYPFSDDLDADGR